VNPRVGEIQANDTESEPGKIDKAVLALSEPRRYRDRGHLKFVSTLPCLLCGRRPSDPHHLRFAQAKALGRRVSDEFTVPLCRLHHRALHNRGDEVAWWAEAALDPITVARKLWRRTRSEGLSIVADERPQPAVNGGGSDFVDDVSGPTKR
jgi:hypothetical protein